MISMMVLDINEHGELRDKDGFNVLDWKKDIHVIVEDYKKNKDTKDRIK